MNDATKHDTDRWPEEARLDMIEKSEWYENPKNYQYGYYDGYQRARAEMLANARLIAAAPEMLDLLKKIADWPFPFLSGKGIDEVRELAGEMVKKVEGEA
jgi:phosphoglycolate phosphatase-like HAD superfamily hydrolase